jgi:hypothetical protein
MVKEYMYYMFQLETQSGNYLEIPVALPIMLPPEKYSQPDYLHLVLGPKRDDFLTVLNEHYKNVVNFTRIKGRYLNKDGNPMRGNAFMYTDTGNITIFGTYEEDDSLMAGYYVRQ